MRKTLSRCACAALVLTCLGLTVLWARSYWVADICSRQGLGAWVLQSNRGQVIVNRTDLSAASAGGVRANPRWAYVGKPAYVVSPSTGSADPGVKLDVDFAGFSLYVTRGGTRPGPSTGRSAGGTTFVVGRMSFHPRWKVALPHWFLIVVPGAVALAVMIKARVRRARSGQQRCRVCGYDLRATPQRCPECGAVPEGVGAAA